MNLNFTKLTACIIGLLFTANAYAQKRDYVIKSNKDSVYCTISRSFFTGNSSYKVNSGKSVKIKPDEIREFHLGDEDVKRRSVVRQGKKKREFMTVLEDGKISLYQEITSNPAVAGPNGTMFPGGSSTQWYLAKGTDTVTEVKNNDFSLATIFNKSRKHRKADFVEFIRDDQAVYDRYKAEDKFSFKQVRNLVHLYNTGELLKKD
jgi:hypothetical protein